MPSERKAGRSRKAITVLLVATAFVALMSEFLVGAVVGDGRERSA